jgi:FPC/CPF motif-containing protein YcgG
MWTQLQAMHAHDSRTFDWAPDVSSDPAEPDFSFSIGGRAYFVVGLHPSASRLARRAPVPCLVFNFHEQFESLRANGKYAGMQKVIRGRDIKLQGSINPVLASFGDRSEARQYSGVSVDDGWQCPFHSAESRVAA